MPSARLFLQKSGKGDYNEFYTLYKDCEKVIGQFDFSELKVYCPCDSERSNIVKYLNGKCKELRFTSDDFHGHEDLFRWADAIVTNPPFSNFSEVYAFFRKFNKKLLICFPLLSCVNKDFLEDYKHGLRICGASNYFINDKGEKRNVKCGWVTNL